MTFKLVIPRRIAGGSHYAGIVAVDAAELVEARTTKRGRRASVWALSRSRVRARTGRAWTAARRA